MYIFISVLILVVSLLLGLIVLVQNPKGGGLAANFTGANTQFMGVKQTTDFLEKTSWALAVALLVLSLAATTIIPRATTEDTQDTEIREQLEDINTNLPPIDYQAPPAQDNPGGQ